MQKKWSNKWWMLQWNAHSLVMRLAVPVRFIRSKTAGPWKFDGISSFGLFSLINAKVPDGGPTSCRIFQWWRSGWGSGSCDSEFMSQTFRVSRATRLQAKVGGGREPAPSKAGAHATPCFISAEVFWSGWRVGPCRCCKSELVLVGSKDPFMHQWTTGNERVY